MMAGKLRHRVTIQRVTETQDSYGAVTETWATFAKVWADIRPLSGREINQNRLINGELTHQIEIRYLEGLIPKMRVLYGTRVFDIESVINEEERDKKHMLMCSEIV